MKLVDKYLNGKATADEEQLLQEYYERLRAGGEQTMSATEEEALRQQLWQKIQAGSSRKPATVVPMPAANWRRYAAAAVVMLAVGLGGYFALNKTDQPIAATNGARPVTEPAPGGNNAVLTLADGSVIVLNEAVNGDLAQQGGTKIIKLDGKLQYTTAGIANGEALYNTLSTPRGGQYQVTLPDGSRVWLNAESSLRFPAQFDGTERRVTVTGEAFFDVTKNKAQPFVVTTGTTTVKVLGTAFNVNAYTDEAGIKTTLLEGAVEVGSGSSTAQLRPGQQARVEAGEKIAVTANVDVENVVAWKEGKFLFENADIETVSRQLSRWYDVEVAYSRKITQRFYLEMPRSSSLSDVLKVLELAGNIRFRVEGKKVVVL